MASQNVTPSGGLHTGRTVEELNNLVARVEALAFQRPQCSWCSPESTPGACDGGHPCPDLSVVHDLEDDSPYCLHHFFNRNGAR